MSIHPESRGFAFLVRATVDGVRDADFAIIGGAGAPSGGVTPTGQSLASTQNGLYCRSDGTDYDEGLYLTLDGGTTWKPAMFNGGSFTIEDTEALKFGTPGTDIVFTADGTDVVVTGTGDLNFVDSVDVSWGTGKDLGIVHDGANSLIANTTGELQIDSAGAVSVESSAGALNVGADAVAQALNLGTGAAARVISIGNAASASMALDAGVGGLTAQADTDIEIDAGTSLNLECSGGTIRVGADNVAQAVAVGTAGARVITVGSAAAASLDLDAGVGAATIQADTTIDIDAGTALGIESAGGAISIGADAVAQAVNIATGAAARVITVGNAASASLALEAGVGAMTANADTSIGLNAGTTLDLDAAGAASLESSAGAINVGADNVAQPVNLATGAAARVITLGNAASASIDIDAGVGGFTAQADTTLDLDAGTTLSINTLGGQTLNIGNDAVAQVITIGNAASNGLAMEAGVGAASITADTTIDLDAAGAIGIESSAAAINVGADAVAQPVNIATGAAARVIAIGNALSASLDMDAGVGGLTAQADTTVDVTAGTELGLEAGTRLSLASTPSRLRGFNRLSDRYELSWVAGEDGLVQLNASAAYAVSRHFEILGTNASDDDVTVSPEGGLIFETDGADGDEVIVLPHLTAGLSPWTSTTWGTDKRVAWECDFTSGPNVTNCIIWAGLKLTNGEAKGVDADSVFFRYEDDVAAGNWEVVYSNTAGETSTDTGVAGALSTRYHLKLVINNDRTVSCYLNGALVETTDALDNTTDLIPYIGVATDGAGPGANKSIILHGQSILRTIG